LRKGNAVCSRCSSRKKRLCSSGTLLESCNWLYR